MLVVENISTSYGKKAVLHDISTAFTRGRITALVGPNGCGKSTLLKAIMGFLPSNGGNILLEGQRLANFSRKQLAQRVSYLPQECCCPDYMTLGELVELAGYARHSLFSGPSTRDRQLYRDVLEIVGLADKASVQINALSGGQRQRAWIAMVLAQDTEIIVMDEPVNHLDIRYQYTVLELIRSLALKQGKTVITVLHDINLTTTFADDVVMLKEGRVAAAGGVAQTMTANNINKVFDIPVDLFNLNGRTMCQPFPALFARQGYFEA